MKMIHTVILSAVIMLAACGAPASAGAKGGPTKSIEVSEPVFPFESHGDLWFSTWADDDTVFMSWGDGRGPEYGGPEDFSHNGLAKLTGKIPDVKVEVTKRWMPLSDDKDNSKPTSMLYLDGRLYVAIHSPLLDPVKGFIAYSDDGGKTFEYDLEKARTLERNRNFICLQFVNMGKNYELDKDGYVYAFGVEGEVNKSGNVYLARMPKESILDESAWTYYSGTGEGGEPEWSADYHDAKRIKELTSKSFTNLFPNMLFSAAYHPGLDRYIVMTAASTEGFLYEGQAPWGPWRKVGRWFEGEENPWYASYMPGIITKGMGPDYFYFTAAGRTEFDPQPGDRMYALKIGRIRMLQE